MCTVWRGVSTESYHVYILLPLLPFPNAAPDAAAIFYILLATCECIYFTAPKIV